MAKRPSVSTIGRLVLQKASTRIWLAGLARHAMTLRANRQVVRDQPQSNSRDSDDSENVPTESFRNRLNAFVSICRSFNIQPVLMTQPTGDERNELTPGWMDDSNQARFNQIIRDVAGEQSVLLIDLVQHIESQKSSGAITEDVFYDAIHVNDYGSDVYAQHISERLLTLLETR